MPFVKDGAGDFTYVTSSPIKLINSWNIRLLRINGAVYTKVWNSRNQSPVTIAADYTFHYVGKYTWSTQK